MLFIGCCAGKETPAVWVWKRISQVRWFFAPKRSFITRYQILRAARYFAISSKKSLCALKKKLRRGPNSSTSRPRRRAHSTYSTPSYNVNASSCSGVDPGRELRSELEGVDHQPHRWRRRIDVLLLCNVFLQDVVLNRTGNLLPI